MNPKELARILAEWHAARASGRPVALATIVRTSGSTYRRAGARYLVGPEGSSSVGNLSGGCLEDAVEEVARRVMVSGEPELIKFDLTADDEAIWGWGLGCNGTIEVFVEAGDAVDLLVVSLATAMDVGTSLAVATVLASEVPGIEPGARMVLDGDGEVTGTLGDAGADDRAREELRGGDGGVVNLSLGDGGVDVFLEVIRPPLGLVICGAGPDALPLAEHGLWLGWNVTVVDDRRVFLREDRWPAGVRLVRCEPQEAASVVGGGARTSVVVMSHNYLRDRAYVQGWLDADCAYLGALGPKDRLSKILGDLERAGHAIPAAGLERMHGPAGLDLGAEGPEEIAAAVAAEVMAVDRRREGGFLRERGAPIHAEAGPRDATV